jgi:hypothetical protein
VDIEKLGDPAGGRGVEHHRVIRIGPPLHTPPDRLVHLAGQQHVAQAGGDRGGEVDGAEPVQRLPGQAEMVEGVQVFQQCVLGIDRQTEHAAAGRGPADPALLVPGQIRHLEQLGDPVAPFHLAQQDAATAGGQGTGQRGSDRGLPGAAFAADDVQGVPGCAGHGRSVTVKDECAL